jgi:uncharacterized protein (DUF433 family)
MANSFAHHMARIEGPRRSGRHIIGAMAQEFIEQRGGGYYFVGSRVSLESVAYQFLQGESPEGIVQAYPSLSLLQVYGGITYYLAYREEIDEYLRRGEARFEELARAAREANPLLYSKLEAVKHATPRA